MSSRSPRHGTPPADTPHALDENVGAIKAWERALRHDRSWAEQLSDRLTAVFASGPVLVGHGLWFVAWIVANTHPLGLSTPFDPFPFPFLTLVVSLEAILLSLLVLISQNRLGRQGDLRAHLDLQIDLLAEREMTAVLRLLQDLATHLGAPTRVSSEQLRDLAATTDLHVLTERMQRIIDDAPESAPERR